jgi:PAS domain-containing protein
VVRDLKMAGLDATERVDLTVRKLQEPAALRGLVLVVFGEGPPPPAASRAGRRGPRAVSRAEATELQREVRQLQEELRRTSEDMQASQEELRSANEELQSTNEELQSTNEELTTSREELQSMNEELQTVNGELQARVEELSRASNDMRNLLDSTHVATLFLDRSLRLRRFTAQATRLLRLIPGDVGREVTDLASDLVYPLLGEDVERVLRTLASSEREIASRDGRWFMARAMPYRTLDDVIDGVVITFADITAAKVLEAELRRSRERFSRLVGHLPVGVALLDEAGRPIAREAVLARIGEATDEAVASWRVVLPGDGPGEGTPP